MTTSRVMTPAARRPIHPAIPVMLVMPVGPGRPRQTRTSRREPRRSSGVRSAVVVGAGVAGLAAAGALARSDWHVTLIERGDRLRGNGGALLIWPNGAAALDSLGVSLSDIAVPLAAG